MSPGGVGLAGEHDLGAEEPKEVLQLRAEACREILFTSWRTGAEEAEWRAAYEEGTDLARRLDDKRTLSMLVSGVGGLRAGGDLIVAIDGREVKRFEDLLRYLINYTSPGDQIVLTVIRADGSQADLNVTLGKRP